MPPSLLARADEVIEDDPKDPCFACDCSPVGYWDFRYTHQCLEFASAFGELRQGMNEWRNPTADAIDPKRNWPLRFILT